MKKLVYILIADCLLLTANLHLSYSQFTGALVPDFKVNDDVTTLNNLGGSIGIDGQGNFLIAWSDYRNLGNRSQIYCQRYNANAQPIGMNFRIGQDSAGGPKVAVLKDGKFIVAWGRQDNDTSVNLYYQRFFVNGQPNGSIRKINDTAVMAIGFLNIGADSIGNFVCIWVDYRNGLQNSDIYCQRFDSTGNKIGNNFKVNDDTTHYSQDYPSLSVYKDGGFVVCWQDSRNIVRGDIYLQRYDNNGIPIGSNQRVNDNINNVFSGGPQVSSNPTGKFVIAWRDNRNEANPNNEMYLQIYDSLGNKVGPNKRADEPTNQLKNGVRCAIKDDGKLFITWLDWRQGFPIIYAQRLDSIGNKIGNNFIVPISINYTDSYINELKISGDRVHSVWNDNRNGNYDVWCNIRSFQNPDSVIGIKRIGIEVPLTFKLFQNFPNPFNPSTKIKFDIPSTPLSFGEGQRPSRLGSDEMRLTIYDILGREIAVLVNQELKPGTYEVEFDGSNYPSEVYFYRLTVNSSYHSKWSDEWSKTKKMVLIK